jgi:hypothetical protein
MATDWTQNLSPQDLAMLKEYFARPENANARSVMTQRGGEGPDTYSNEFSSLDVGGRNFASLGQPVTDPMTGKPIQGARSYSTLIPGQDNLYASYDPEGNYSGTFSTSNDFFDKFGRALPYITGAALGGIAAFGGAAGAGASDMAMINGGGFANTPSYLVPNLSALPAEAMVSGGGISGLPGYLMNPGGGAAAEAAAGGGILGGATGASGTAAGSGVATGTAGVSGAAGAAANSAGGLLGSTAGKIAAAAAGGLLGSQATTNSTNSQSKIDPRMEKYLYGDGNTQGILDQAYQWQQANKSGLNDQMRQGLATINRVASDPSGYQAIQQQGLSLMNQPVAGNPFSNGQATLQTGTPQALRNLGFK